MTSNGCLFPCRPPKATGLWVALGLIVLSCASAAYFASSFFSAG